MTNNVIANDEMMKTAHFGLLKNGSMFIGYPRQDDLQNFRHLVGGALWIITAGKPNWEQAMSIEDEQVQETGPWSQFVKVASARTSIGLVQ